jgi:exopolysaccharide biosynthesis polyprenyl glycosylphosphotransferase
LIIKRLFQHYRIRVPKWIVSWSILTTDTIAGYIAYSIVLQDVVAKYFPHVIEQILIWAIFQILWNIIFLISGLYKGEFVVSRMHEIETMLKITFTIVVLYVFIDALRFIDFPINARGMARYWLIYMSIALSIRFIIRSFQKLLLRNGVGREKTIILGKNRRGQSAADYLIQHEDQGYDIVGYIEASDDPNEKFDTGKIPILGHEHDLRKIIQDNEVSDIVLALDSPDHTRIISIMGLINGFPVTVKIVPDLYDVMSGLLRTQQIAGMPLMDINLEYSNWYQRGLKRIVDLIITIPLVIIFLPVGIIIALAIKVESKGPVFYQQVRVGKDFKKFKTIKFRSMLHNAEDKTGPIWSKPDDPRITKVGKLLRRFRIDEFPQFINVIKGDMSIIGPRPERPYFVEKLSKEYPLYHRRLSVLPGISGWSQIKQSYDTNFEDIRQKLKYDFYYIENLSFGLDLKIMISTIWVMFSGEGR